MSKKTKRISRMFAMAVLIGLISTPIVAYSNHTTKTHTKESSERLVEITSITAREGKTSNSTNMTHKDDEVSNDSDDESAPSSTDNNSKNYNITVTNSPSPTPKATQKVEIKVIETETPKPTVIPKPTVEPTKAPKTPTPTEKVEEEQEENCTYNQDDIKLMSHLVYAEAGDEGWDEMVYVGSVALNRVRHSDYPNTLYEVVYQSGQYACTWDGNIQKTPSDLAMRVAKYLLENGSQIPSLVVYQAGFLQGSGVWKQTSYHYYCYY